MVQINFKKTIQNIVEKLLDSHGISKAHKHLNPVTVRSDLASAVLLFMLELNSSASNLCQPFEYARLIMGFMNCTAN